MPSYSLWYLRLIRSPPTIDSQIPMYAETAACKAIEMEGSSRSLFMAVTDTIPPFEIANQALREFLFIPHLALARMLNILSLHLPIAVAERELLIIHLSSLLQMRQCLYPAHTTVRRLFPMHSCQGRGLPTMQAGMSAIYKPLEALPRCDSSLDSSSEHTTACAPVCTQCPVTFCHAYVLPCLFPLAFR